MEIRILNIILCFCLLFPLSSCEDKSGSIVDKEEAAIANWKLESVKYSPRDNELRLLEILDKYPKPTTEPARHMREFSFRHLAMMYLWKNNRESACRNYDRFVASVRRLESVWECDVGSIAYVYVLSESNDDYSSLKHLVKDRIDSKIMEVSEQYHAGNILGAKELLVEIIHDNQLHGEIVAWLHAILAEFEYQLGNDSIASEELSRAFTILNQLAGSGPGAIETSMYLVYRSLSLAPDMYTMEEYRTTAELLLGYIRLQGDPAYLHEAREALDLYFERNKEKQEQDRGGV